MLSYIQSQAAIQTAFDDYIPLILKRKDFMKHGLETTVFLLLGLISNISMAAGGKTSTQEAKNARFICEWKDGVKQGVNLRATIYSTQPAVFSISSGVVDLELSSSSGDIFFGRHDASYKVRPTNPQYRGVYTVAMEANNSHPGPDVYFGRQANGKLWISDSWIKDLELSIDLGDISLHEQRCKAVQGVLAVEGPAAVEFREILNVEPTHVLSQKFQTSEGWLSIECNTRSCKFAGDVDHNSITVYDKTAEELRAVLTLEVDRDMNGHFDGHFETSDRKLMIVCIAGVRAQCTIQVKTRY